MSAARQSRLGLDDPSRPVPTRPSWFHADSGQEDRLSFETLAELARHIVRRSEGRGLRLSALPAITCVCGLDPFPAWSVYAQGEHGDEDWLGHAAIQEISRDRLEAAILAARGASQRAAA